MIFNQITLERAVAQTKKNAPKNLGAKMAKRRRNAIDKAHRLLQTNPYIHYENGKLLLLSDSRTETGEAKFYETSRNECRLIEPGNFLCHAFWEGFPCWHRAAHEIIVNYLSLAEKLTESEAPGSVSGVNSCRRREQ